VSSDGEEIQIGNIMSNNSETHSSFEDGQTTDLNQSARGDQNMNLRQLGIQGHPLSQVTETRRQLRNFTNEDSTRVDRHLVGAQQTMMANDDDPLMTMNDSLNIP
jgi:hypothetical protein